MEEDEEDECLTIDEDAEPPGFQSSNPKIRKLNPPRAYYTTSGGTVVTAGALNTLLTFVNPQTGLNYAQVSQPVFNNQVDGTTAHNIYNSRGDLNTAQQFVNNQAVINAAQGIYNCQVGGNTAPHIFNNQVGENAAHPISNNHVGENAVHPIFNKHVSGNVVHPIFNNQVGRNTTHPIVNNQMGGNISPHISNNHVGGNTAHPISNNQIGGNAEHRVINNRGYLNNPHHFVNNQEIQKSAPPVSYNRGAQNTGQNFVNNQASPNTAQIINYAGLMKNVDLKTLYATGNPNYANESNGNANYPTQTHHPRVACKNFARMPCDNGNKLNEIQKKTELYALLMAREPTFQSKANNTANQVAVNPPNSLKVPNYNAYKAHETNYRLNNQPELLVAPSPQILGNLLNKNNTLPTPIYRDLNENMMRTRDAHSAILSNQGIPNARYATEMPPHNHRVDMSNAMNCFATSNAYGAVPMAHHQNQQINMNGNSHVRPIYPDNPVGPPRAYLEAMMNRQRNPPTGVCMDPCCSGLGQPIQPVNTATTQIPRLPPPPYPNMPTCTCPGPCEAEKAIAYFNAHPGAPVPSFLTQDSRENNEQTYNIYNSIPQHTHAQQHIANSQSTNAAITRNPLVATVFPQAQNKKRVVYSIPDSTTNGKQNAKRASRKRTLTKSNTNYGIDVMTNEVRSFAPRLPPSHEASANNINIIPNRDSLGLDNTINTFHITKENITSERSPLPNWEAIEQNVGNKRKPVCKKNTISYKPKVKVSRLADLNQMLGQQPDINNITHSEQSLLNQVANCQREQMIIPVEKYEVTVSYNKSDVINSTQVPSGSVEQLNGQQTRTTNNVNKTQIATTVNSCDEEEDVVITENELPLLNISQEQGKTIKQSLIESIGALQSNLQQARIEKDSERSYSINTEASKQTSINTNVENELAPLNINNNGQMGSAQISKTIIQTNIDFHENKASSNLAAAKSVKDYIESNTPVVISNSCNNLIEAEIQPKDTITEIPNVMKKNSEKTLKPQQRHGTILHTDEEKVDAGKSTNGQQVSIATNVEKVQTSMFKELTQNTAMDTNLDSVSINMNNYETQTLRSFRKTKAKTKVEEFTTPANFTAVKGRSMPDLEIPSGAQLEGLSMNISPNTEHVRNINNIAISETVISPQQVKMKLVTDVVNNHSMQNNNDLAATGYNMIKESEPRTQNAFIKSNTDKIFTQQNINANKISIKTEIPKTKVEISTTQTSTVENIIHDIEGDEVGSRSDLEISGTQFEGLDLNMKKTQAIIDVEHASQVYNITTSPLEGKVKILPNIETDKGKQINNEQGVTESNINTHSFKDTIDADKTLMKSKTDRKEPNANTDKTQITIVLNKTESKVEHGKNIDNITTTETLTSHQVNINVKKDVKKRKHHNEERTLTDVNEKKHSKTGKLRAKQAFIQSNTDNNLSQKNVNADKTQDDKIETPKTVEQAKPTTTTAAEDIHDTGTDNVAYISDPEFRSSIHLEELGLTIEKTQAFINADKVDSSANAETVISPQDIDMKMSNNIEIIEKNNEQSKIESIEKKHSNIYNIHSAYMKLKNNRKHHKANADKLQGKAINKSKTGLNKAKVEHAKKVSNTTAIMETVASSHQVKLKIDTDTKEKQHKNNEKNATGLNMTKHATGVEPHANQAFTKSDADNILSRKNVNSDKTQSDKREISISVKKAKSTTQTALPAAEDIHTKNDNMVSKSDLEIRSSTHLEGVGLTIDKTQASINKKHAANNAITEPYPLEVKAKTTTKMNYRKQNKNEQVVPDNNVKKGSIVQAFKKLKMNRKHQKKSIDKILTEKIKISNTVLNKAKSKVKHAKKINPLASTETVASSHQVNIKMSTDIKKNNERSVTDANVKKHLIGVETYAKHTFIKSNTDNRNLSRKNVNADQTQSNKKEINKTIKRLKSTTNSSICAAEDIHDTKIGNIASISDPEIRSGTHPEGIGLSIDKTKPSINVKHAGRDSNRDIAKQVTSPLQIKVKTQTNMKIDNKKQNIKEQAVTENNVRKRSNIDSQTGSMKLKITKKLKKTYPDKTQNKIPKKCQTPIFSTAKKIKQNRSKRGHAKNKKLNVPDTLVREKSTNSEFQTELESCPKKNNAAPDLLDGEIYKCIAKQIQDSIDKERTKSSSENTQIYKQRSETTTHNDQVNPQAMEVTKKPSIITGATAQETSTYKNIGTKLNLLKINSYKSQPTTETSRSIFQTSNDILLNSENTDAETVINTNSKLSFTNQITKTVTVEQQTPEVAFEALSIDFLKSVLENATRKPVTKISDNTLSDENSEYVDTRGKYTATNPPNKEEIGDESENGTNEKFYRARQKLARLSVLDKNKISQPDCAHDIAKTKNNTTHNYSSIISYVLDKYLSQMTPVSCDIEDKHDICNIKDEPIIENNNYLEPAAIEATKRLNDNNPHTKQAKQSREETKKTEVDENKIKQEQGINTDEELNIDEILFYNFQLEFFPRLFCKLKEQGYHESAKKVDYDIYNLVYQSDDSNAKPDMEFKCPVCNSVSIYSPQEIYINRYDHRLIQSVNMVRYCQICITFRIQYITLLKKYIDKHTKMLNTSTEETHDPSCDPSSKCDNQNKPQCTETHSNSSLSNDSKLNKQSTEYDPLDEQMSRINGDPLNSKKTTNDNLNKTGTEKNSSDQQDDTTSKIMVKIQCNMLKTSTVESLIKLKSTENKNTSPSNNIPKRLDDSYKKGDIKNAVTTECVKDTNPEKNGPVATYNANKSNKKKKEDHAEDTKINIVTNINEDNNKDRKSNQHVSTLTESTTNTHEKVSIRICMRNKASPYIINKHTCSDNIIISSNKNIINYQTNCDNTRSIKKLKIIAKGTNAESKNKKMFMFNVKPINNKQKNKTLANSINKKSKKNIYEKHRKADNWEHKVADANSKVSQDDKREINDNDDQTSENAEDSSSSEDDNDNEATQITTKALNNAFKKIKHNLKINQASELPKVFISEKTNAKLANSKPKPDATVTRPKMLYTCGVCTIEYAYLGPYLKHMRNEHDVTDSEVTKDCIYQRCAFCPEVTTQITHNSHIKKKHLDKYNEKKRKT